MKKIVSCLSVIVFVIVLGTLQASSVQAQTDAMTRGEFFKAITDYLKLKPEYPVAKLPVDVEEQSVYGDSVRALTERKIIYGYPDGTIRLQEAINAVDADYVLARFLGIADEVAVQKMKTEFQVTFSSNGKVDPDQATKVIRTVLENDRSLIQNLKDARNQHMKVITSYKTNTKQIQNYQLTSNSSTTPITGIESTTLTEFHKDKGFHLKSVISYPSKETVKGIEMEQYIVPSGNYIKMNNSNMKEAKSNWIKGIDVMPFNFEQLMSIQMEASKPKQIINDQYYFYRSLGTEVIKGKKIHKIQVFGSLPTISNISGFLTSTIGDNNQIDELLNSSATNNLSLAINGIIYIDVESNLLTRVDWVQSIRNGMPNTSVVPFKQIEVETSIQYYDYNQVLDVTLPEVALQTK